MEKFFGGYLGKSSADPMFRSPFVFFVLYWKLESYCLSAGMASYLAWWSQYSACWAQSQWRPHGPLCLTHWRSLLAR